MGKSPGFWFFTGDWLKDSELRFCSLFARGLLVDLLCIMFEAKEQGYMSKPDGTPRSDVDIVDAISGSTRDEKLKALAELESSGVLSRDNRNVLYSRRLSKLKELSELRSKSGSKGGSKTQAKLKQTDKQTDKQKQGVTVTDPLGSVPAVPAVCVLPTPELTTSGKHDQPSAPCAKKHNLEKPNGVEQEAWDDWIAVRKAQKKGVPTATSLKRVRSQAAKLGWDIGQAIEYAASKSWSGFEASWVKDDPDIGFQQRVVDFSDPNWEQRRPR